MGVCRWGPRVVGKRRREGVEEGGMWGHNGQKTNISEYFILILFFGMDANWGA